MAKPCNSFKEETCPSPPRCEWDAENKDCKRPNQSVTFEPPASQENPKNLPLIYKQNYDNSIKRSPLIIINIQNETDFIARAVTKMLWSQGEVSDDLVYRLTYKKPDEPIASTLFDWEWLSERPLISFYDSPLYDSKIKDIIIFTLTPSKFYKFIFKDAKAASEWLKKYENFFKFVFLSNTAPPQPMDEVSAVTVTKPKKLIMKEDNIKLNKKQRLELNVPVNQLGLGTNEVVKLLYENKPIGIWPVPFVSGEASFLEKWKFAKMSDRDLIPIELTDHTVTFYNNLKKKLDSYQHVCSVDFKTREDAIRWLNQPTNSNFFKDYSKDNPKRPPRVGKGEIYDIYN